MTPRHPTRGFEGDETTPPPSVDVETVRNIAMDKAGLAVAQHDRDCKRTERLHMRVDQVESTQRTHEAFINKYIGGQGVWTVIRVVSVPILIAAATWVLNHLGELRAAEQQRHQQEVSAEVRQELKAVQEVTKVLLDSPMKVVGK
jgi:hypothetical protein